MDTVPPAVRSRMMSGIRDRNTKPEMVVRRMVHRLGLRFRLHRRELPGTPDLVLPRHKTVILVHGCFWHRHGCPLSATPKTREQFWNEKFGKNVERDQRIRLQLQELGWRVIEVWECESREPQSLEKRLKRSFGLK